MNIKKENVLKAYKEGCEEVKKVLENLFPDIIEKEETYGVGDRFRLGEQEHLLASIGKRTVVLICIENGHYWDDPKEVQDIHLITENEFTDLLQNPDCRVERTN